MPDDQTLVPHGLEIHRSTFYAFSTDLRPSPIRFFGGYQLTGSDDVLARLTFQLRRVSIFFFLNGKQNKFQKCERIVLVPIAQIFKHSPKHKHADVAINID